MIAIVNTKKAAPWFILIDHENPKTTTVTFLQNMDTFRAKYPIRIYVWFKEYFTIEELE